MHKTTINKLYKRFKTKDYELITAMCQIQESDSLTEEDLKKIDHQLQKYNLSISYFENGSALAWFIMII